MCYPQSISNTLGYIVEYISHHMRREEKQKHDIPVVKMPHLPIHMYSRPSIETSFLEHRSRTPLVAVRYYSKVVS